MSDLDKLQQLTHGVEEILPPEELAARLAEGRPLRIKAGFDPTAPDLHLGHTVLLNKLRSFQEQGHDILFLVGDFTARIGDPTGRSATRPPLTPDVIADNARTYADQVFRVLDRERTQILFNSRWISALAPEDLVRLMATYTVARLLERDDFHKRHAAGQPIGVHEFLYPLLQGYDSVAMRADVELGGTDQKFNLLVGRELQKHFGQRPQVVLTLPLLEGLDGVQKMSKSLGNYIGINEPAESIFGKIMSVSDSLMWRYYSLISARTPAELQKLRAQVDDGLNPRDVKMQLAHELASRFAGAPAAEAARADFVARFQERGMPDHIAEQTLVVPAEGLPWPQALKQTGLTPSTSEALRLARQAGVRLDGSVPSDPQLKLQPGTTVLLQVGRRKFLRLHLTTPA